MLPSTGYIKTFDLKQYENGVILLGPSESDKTKAKEYVPQPKLAKEKNIEIVEVSTMKELGKISGIDVKSSAVLTLE